MEAENEYLLKNLKNKFEYDEVHGRLVLKGTCVDKSILTSRGYRKLAIDGHSYLLHRLIFLYHYGYFPEVVDHIDGDLKNNKIENLQGCTQVENIAKARLFKTNKTGFKGVSLHKSSGKYESYFWKNYQKFYCGLHDTAEDAFKAREEKKYGKA